MTICWVGTPDKVTSASKKCRRPTRVWFFVGAEASRRLLYSLVRLTVPLCRGSTILRIGNLMNKQDEILRALGRIEGELVEIRKLSERVRKLEFFHSLLKGAWLALTG